MLFSSLIKVHGTLKNEADILMAGKMRMREGM